MAVDVRARRTLNLLAALRRPPPGRARILFALALGLSCHLLFAAAVAMMMVSMFFGMTLGRGRLPPPYGLLMDALLLLQFPLAHSLLLSRRGGQALKRLAPAGEGARLATTSYALIASIQLILLFSLWTPSGLVWWRAEGALVWVIAAVGLIGWLLLFRAIFDAGLEVQTGALGWMSAVADRAPVFPDMPVRGLFRLIRQPIYAAFALTPWAVGVWTPDQAAVAIVFTLYCLLAPRLKERRFARRYGARFLRYRESVPYFLPRLSRIRALLRPSPNRSQAP